MTREYTVLRTERKTLSIEIKRDLRVVVHAPLNMRDADIARFVREKEKWIAKHIELLRGEQDEKQPDLTLSDIRALADAAREDMLARVGFYAPKVGVSVTRITIRNQITRWGSCSSKGNLNFNCLLMLCPPEIRDYVVVHELCHCRELNHSPRFWALVEQILPDYKVRRKWLADNGKAIIGRMG